MTQPARPAPLAQRASAARGGLVLVLLLIVLALAVVASLGIGARSLSAGEILHLLVAPDDSTEAVVLWELRLPRTLLGRRSTAVSLSYGEAAIPFLAWARAHGAHESIDGLGMLVEQAVTQLGQHGKEADMLRAVARYIIERDH